MFPKWILLFVEILFLLVFINAMFLVPGGPSVGTYIVAVSAALVAGLCAVESGRRFIRDWSANHLTATRVLLSPPSAAWLCTVGLALLIRLAGFFYHTKKPLI